jgi:predicted  nucleic acid-binding Zn-ribbon protein
MEDNSKIPNSNVFAINTSPTNNEEIINEEFRREPQLEGAKQAARANCDVSVLKMWFNKIYQQIREGIQNMSDSQLRQVDDLEQKVVGLSSHNETLKGNISGLKENISKKEQKIQESNSKRDQKLDECNNEVKFVNEEIDKIRSGDKSFIDDESKESDKLGFWLGTVILFFLTLYLFIFYISVIYSAFIFDVKEWVINNSNNKKILTNTIVNLEAIPDTSSKHGIIGVIFLFSAAFLFIGLGYLIHKFSESKAVLKSFLIYTFTFLFDALLAYSIVRDIHVAKYEAGDLTTAWSFSKAFVDTNFYIILMAGFSIYIIWGIILSYVLKEYDNLAPAKVAVRNRKIKIKYINKEKEEAKELHDKRKTEIDKEIDFVNEQIFNIDKKIENNKTAIDSNNSAIENIKRKIEIPIAEVKRIITAFTVGWTNQINLLFPEDQAPKKALECMETKEAFFVNISNNT